MKLQEFQEFLNKETEEFVNSFEHDPDMCQEELMELWLNWCQICLEF